VLGRRLRGAGHAFINFSADQFPAGCHPDRQRRDAGQRDDGDHHPAGRRGHEGHSRRAHRAFENRARRGGNQRIFHLANGYGAGGAVRAGSACGRAKNLTGDRKFGGLTWSPRPIEIKLFSTDVEWLKQKAPQVEAELKKIDGIVDTFDGLETTGPSLSLRVRDSDTQRFGLTVNDVALAVGTAMLGQKASYVLEGDRVVNIRVRMNADTTGQIAGLRELPLRSLDGRTVKLSQVADVVTEPGQLELHREDLRQLVAVSARLENRDLGSAIAEIKAKLDQDQTLPPGVLEFGGLYQQQQESFHNLLVVLLASIFLVFTVLLVEFGSFYEAIAIVFGSVLALCGTVLAWYLTGTSVNIVALLGAIIGIGVVAKNGILMLDSVHRFESQGVTLENALVESGRRRLRPVLMTSLAAALGLLPLAYGIGAGSDMLKPLAIAVIGALTLSVLLSLVATPTVYFAMRR